MTNKVIVLCNKEHDIDPTECCFCRAEKAEQAQIEWGSKCVALTERLAEIERETIERCARECDQVGKVEKMAGRLGLCAADCAYAIRALAPAQNTPCGLEQGDAKEDASSLPETKDPHQQNAAAMQEPLTNPQGKDVVLTNGADKPGKEGVTPASAAAPTRSGPDSVICHAPGDKCLGCDHYYGKALVCKYAVPGYEHVPMGPVGTTYIGDITLESILSQLGDHGPEFRLTALRVIGPLAEDAEYFRLLPKFVAAIIWLKSATDDLSPLGHLKNGFTLDDLRIWCQAAIDAARLADKGGKNA